MNILKPIDYIVYKISRVNRTGLDKRDPEIWVRCLLAAWLIFNYATILIWTKFTNLSNLFKTAGIFTIIFMNIYYNRSRFLNIQERYKNESPKQKLWGSIVVIIYMVATVVLFACALIYPL